MTTVTTNFTATGVGVSFLIKSGDKYSYSLSGTFSATCRIETSSNNGLSWDVVESSASVIASTIRANQTARDFIVRWNCIAFTSGTAETVAADVDILIEEIVNNRGVPVVQTTEAGQDVLGNHTVSGDQTVTGSQTVAGSAITTANVGAAGTGTTAVEGGDATHHTTTLTVAGVLPAITGGVDQAVGTLLYTFPAGDVVINHAKLNLSITQSEGNINNDTPDVGLGTVIGTGAVAALSTTLEDIIVGQTATDSNGTATVKTAIPTAAVPFVIESGDAHTLHFNAAFGWAASGDLAATIAGTVVLEWDFVE
jgi:hypothetical protein